ncbi:uncharacterized protein LOC121376829 [Gigantopelta aegis]|uniref:uncharacterized protein LOC121376829 n=1 Tax=Gigantopelta aegis TaxID=1735272 RepID=UPI001B88A8B2|nr:uncharacterized protein LOC121376829 [Gigantopelta aegis]XP_041360542.1 uncharacterized protein LOC121376829 [Gigantopelta aegis]
MELDEQQIGELVNVFHKMGLEPKLDTSDDLKTWIHGMSQQQGPLLKTEDPLPPPPPPKESAVFPRFPKLSFFSGDRQGKDTTFDLWTYEVNCLIQDKAYGSEVISQAIRQSLRGEAARVAMRLGPKASTKDILAKLGSIFGTVQRREALMAQFYGASQGAEEDISAWGCRLEHLLSKVTEHHPVPLSEQDEMLRNMIWSGLIPGMKAVSGHKFDSIHSFDALRIALREIEYDMKSNLASAATALFKKPASVKMASVSDTVTRTDLDKLTSVVQDLCSQVSDLKHRQDSTFVNQQQFQNPASQPRLDAPYNQSRGDRKMFTRGVTPYYSQQSGPRRTSQYVDDTRPKTGMPTRNYSQHTSSFPDGNNFEDAGVTGYEYQEPVCYRCGYSGHIVLGCRVRVDHLRRPLNSRGLMRRGRP